MLKVDDLVKVVSNRNNHSYIIGNTYKIHRINMASGTYVLRDITTGRTGNHIRTNDFRQMCSREDFLSVYKETYKSLYNKLKELSKEVLTARNELKILEKYTTDEEELLAIIEELIASDGNENKIKATLTKYNNGKNIKFETFMNEYFT